MDIFRRRRLNQSVVEFSADWFNGRKTGEMYGRGAPYRFPKFGAPAGLTGFTILATLPVLPFYQFAILEQLAVFRHLSTHQSTNRRMYQRIDASTIWRLNRGTDQSMSQTTTEPRNAQTIERIAPYRVRHFTVLIILAPILELPLYLFDHSFDPFPVICAHQPISRRINARFNRRTNPSTKPSTNESTNGPWNTSTNEQTNVRINQ